MKKKGKKKNEINHGIGGDGRNRCKEKNFHLHQRITVNGDSAASLPLANPQPEMKPCDASKRIKPQEETRARKRERGGGALNFATAIVHIHLLLLL